MWGFNCFHVIFEVCKKLFYSLFRLLLNVCDFLLAFFLQLVIFLILELCSLPILLAPRIFQLRIHFFQLFELRIEIINHERLLGDHKACFFKFELWLFNFVNVLLVIATYFSIKFITVLLCLSQCLLGFCESFIHVSVLCLQLLDLFLQVL